ncbi:MAG: hypothetical protein IPJ79_10810 [Bacteroidetes bacterium]|nr:hypothetical protein [Bacteroidota bacterium]
MTLVFGTGLPTGPPGNDRYKDTYRFPFYRRVDIGLPNNLLMRTAPKITHKIFQPF